MNRPRDEYTDAGISAGPGAPGEGGSSPSRRRRMGAGRGRRSDGDRTEPVTDPSEESVRAAERATDGLPVGDPDLPQSSYLPAPLPPLDVARMTRSVPGVARIAVVSAVNTADWSIRTYLSVVRRLLRSLVDPAEASRLARDLGVTVGTIGELSKRLATGMSLQQAVVEVTSYAEEEHEHEPAPRRAGAEDLRDRGQALLARSRDVWNDETAHPAYERILDELAPDEARILILLHREGPQPSVDVRTGGPIGMVSSELLAPGLTMIGARAGVRHEDFVPAYLNNLFRLGLLWFSHEHLKDPMPYQVLEAQPDVLASLHSVKFAKVVRRSLHLTPFGHDFCGSVLADDTDDPAELPEHGTPSESPGEPPRP